jgi:hypothetical protein
MNPPKRGRKPGFSPIAPDQRKRQVGIKLTERQIETGKRIGAGSLPKGIRALLNLANQEHKNHG